MKRLLAVLYLCLLFPSYAHAYSDPGSGLMLWQLIVSFFIGAMFYFRKIWGFLIKAVKRNEE
ncbi:hypothetical protein L4X63_19255 [Geomonas sp. Red32]|uniref:hypothetical protein n=1 Tax=Geomonas sp. Red32 TaxID=2912856 RepID=UPI00202CD282|nr:hypothetical protein [Geomonas sp. Red32]MCM0083730.1 hypothetical protein [Geomonas sp. Red32]